MALQVDWESGSRLASIASKFERFGLVFGGDEV